MTSTNMEVITPICNNSNSQSQNMCMRTSNFEAMQINEDYTCLQCYAILQNLSKVRFHECVPLEPVQSIPTTFGILPPPPVQPLPSATATSALVPTLSKRNIFKLDLKIMASETSTSGITSSSEKLLPTLQRISQQGPRLQSSEECSLQLQKVGSKFDSEQTSSDKLTVTSLTEQQKSERQKLEFRIPKKRLNLPSYKTVKTCSEIKSQQQKTVLRKSTKTILRHQTLKMLKIKQPTSLNQHLSEQTILRKRMTKSLFEKLKTVRRLSEREPLEKCAKQLKSEVRVVLTRIPQTPKRLTEVRHTIEKQLGNARECQLSRQNIKNRTYENRDSKDLKIQQQPYFQKIVKKKQSEAKASERLKPELQTIKQQTIQKDKYDQLDPENPILRIQRKIEQKLLFQSIFGSPQKQEPKKQKTKQESLNKISSTHKGTKNESKKETPEQRIFLQKQKSETPRHRNANLKLRQASSTCRKIRKQSSDNLSDEQGAMDQEPLTIKKNSKHLFVQQPTEKETPAVPSSRKKNRKPSSDFQSYENEPLKLRTLSKKFEHGITYQLSSGRETGENKMQTMRRTSEEKTHKKIRHKHKNQKRNQKAKLQTSKIRSSKKCKCDSRLQYNQKVKKSKKRKPGDKTSQEISEEDISERKIKPKFIPSTYTYMIFGEAAVDRYSWNGFVEDVCVLCDAEFETGRADEHMINPVHRRNVIDNICVCGFFYLYRKLDDDQFFCVTCCTVYRNIQMDYHHQTDDHAIGYYKAKQYHIEKRKEAEQMADGVGKSVEEYNEHLIIEPRNTQKKCTMKSYTLNTSSCVASFKRN